MQRVLKPARHATSDELVKLVAQIEEAYSTPEAREELRQLGEKINGRGSPDYQDFVRRSKEARWYNEIKDITFMSPAYS